MWTSVFMSKDEETAKKVVKALRDGKIISMIKRNEEFYEILVPSQEVNAAHGIIIEIEI